MMDLKAGASGKSFDIEMFFSGCTSAIFSGVLQAVKAKAEKPRNRNLIFIEIKSSLANIKI